MAIIAPAIRRADASRWDRFVSSLPPEHQEFLVAKWRLHTSWNPGDGPPQPRSVAEMEAFLGVVATDVRALDWFIVDHARNIHRRYEPMLPRLLEVPIDAAQEWWDEAWGWMYNPDGSEKPREQWGPERGTARRIEQGKQVHEFEDDERLIQHLVADHHAEYVRQGQRGYSIFHRMAHVDEAEDADWDRRLRGIDSPGTA